MGSSPPFNLLGALAVALAACALSMLSKSALLPRPSQLQPLLQPQPSCSVKGGAFIGYYHSYGYLAGLEERRSYANSYLNTSNMSSAKTPHHPRLSTSRSYTCYSGGCFAALTHMLGIPLERVLDVGVKIQGSWMSGEVSRFDVVKHFLEEILPSFPNSNSTSSNYNFEPLNIITTGTTGKPITSKPKDVAEVHDLLIKTSWIPLITGNSIFYDGQIDGFLSSHSHPSFAEEVPGLPWNLEGFKLSLTRADAEAAYNNGFALALNTTINHVYC